MLWMLKQRDRKKKQKNKGNKNSFSPFLVAILHLLTEPNRLSPPVNTHLILLNFKQYLHSTTVTT